MRFTQRQALAALEASLVMAFDASDQLGGRWLCDLGNAGRDR
jgi:hypothetical protein